MVVVERAEKYRSCNSCCTNTGVYNITVYSDVTKQGTQIALCDACIADLYIEMIKCNHEVKELERDK